MSAAPLSFALPEYTRINIDTADLSNLNEITLEMTRSAAAISHFILKKRAIDRRYRDKLPGRGGVSPESQNSREKRSKSETQKERRREGEYGDSRMRANQGVARHFRRPGFVGLATIARRIRARRQRATSVGAINDRGGWPRVNGEETEA